LNVEEYREYCISKPGVTEGFPFDQSTLVFKVMNKMFALADIDTFDFINLKCDPERAIQFREEYNGIEPGWHMNKQQWNSVFVNSDVPDPLLRELIDHSYELIVAKLTKKDQTALKELG